MTSFGDQVLNMRLPCSRNGGLTLNGRSMAGHWTCIACVELGICFDIGAPSHAACGCGVLCISHGHTDHINSLATHARVRRMKGGPKPLYLVPPVCQEPITAMFRASHLLDCGANSQDREKAMKEEEEEDGSHIFFSDDDDAKPIIPQKKRKKMATSGKGKAGGYKVPLSDPEPETKYFKLLGVEHEEGVVVGGGLTVIPLKTTHTVSSFGYCVIEKRKKLKQKYRGLPSSEIRDAIRRGEQINTFTTVPLVAFTGDTTIEGVLNNPLFLEAEILIIECTALDHGLAKEKCRDRGHIHLEELNEFAERFMGVGTVVLTHFSCRYQRKEVVDKVTRSRFGKVNAGRFVCFV